MFQTQLALLFVLVVNDVFGFQPIKSPTHLQGPQLPSIETEVKASQIDNLIPLKKGSTCALITPMDRNGNIDMFSLERLLQYHLDGGTDNLCVLGTTAEASVMTMNERKAVLEKVVGMVKGKIPIMVGTGTINPESVKAMTQQAIDLGADANLLVSPYYVKPPQRSLIRHFVNIADMGLPMILYNVPGRTGVDLKDENIAICAQHENIIGLKEATGNVARAESIRNLVGDDFLLYSGDDGTTLDFMWKGGDGCISVTANLAPNLMHQMVHAALNGDWDKAKGLNKPLIDLHNNLFCESNPIPAKWCANRLGLIDTPFCRAPLDTMGEQYEGLLEDSLRGAGLLV